MDIRPEREGGGKKFSNPSVICVLVVDDDAEARKTMKAVLRSAHAGEAVVDTADSAAVAMQWIESGYAPDVIFCDHQMPDMTGIEFYEWIRKRHPEWAGQFCLLAEAMEESALADLEGMGCRCAGKAWGKDRLQQIFRLMLSEGKPQ